jgi:hypothetical protein
MAVAIINSNAHGHVHKKGNFGDYSPCHTHYKNRYAIGIHKANKDDLERFQSREGNHYYVSQFAWIAVEISFDGEPNLII